MFSTCKNNTKNFPPRIRIDYEKGTDEKKSVVMCKTCLKAVGDSSSNYKNTSSVSPVQSVIINSSNPFKLKQILRDSGALSKDGKLQQVSTSALTVKLVMAAINVINFSHEEIFMWLIKSCTTKFLNFNEKFDRQFRVYKILYRLILVNINLPNGQELLSVIGRTRYITPRKMSSWYIIFRSIPFLLDTVPLSLTIQEQSKALNMVHLSKLSRSAIGNETASSATVGGSKTDASCDDNTSEKEDTDASLDVTTDFQDIQQNENVNIILTDEGLEPDCPCSSSTLTLEAVKHFLTKIEASMSFQFLEKPVQECDVLQRMTRIEEYLAFREKARHSEGCLQIISEINQEELHFKMNFIQLQRTLQYVQSKDDNNDHYFQKQDTLKENVMLLYNCYKVKSKKISFLRSQVHLLENIINHCMHQMLRQKRVNEIIRAKLVLVEKCYFSQRSLLHQQKCVNRMPTHESSMQTEECLDSSMSTAVGSYENCAAPNSTMFTLGPSIQLSQHSPLCGDYPYFSNRDGAGLQGNYSQAFPLLHKEYEIKPQLNSVAVQCELIYEQCVVLQIPSLATVDEINKAEIIAVRDSITRAANETSKSITDIVSDHTAALFKCVLEKMILYQLMLDNKAFLDISLPTSSSVCVFRPCDVFPDKDSALQNKFISKKCPKNSVIMDDTNKKNCSSEQTKAIQLINENPSVITFSPVMALIKNPNLWTELPEPNVNQLVNDLFSFLMSKNKSLISKSNKQKFMRFLNDEESFEGMINLCLKIKTNHSYYLRQMNVINDSFNTMCIVKMEKMEHKFSQLEALVRQYEIHLMKNKNAITTFSDTVRHSSSKIKLLESKLKHISERDNFLFDQLHNIHLNILETLSFECLDGNDSLTTSPSLETSNIDSLLDAKVSSIFNLTPRLTQLKEKLSKYNNVKTFHNNLLSCTDLVTTLMNSQERLNKVKIGLQTMKQQVDKMSVLQGTVQKLQDQITEHNHEIAELPMNVNAVRNKLMAMTIMKQQDLDIYNHTKSKFDNCIAEAKQKGLEFQVATELLSKERKKSFELQKKLNESYRTIDQLVVIWEVLEFSNKGPHVDLHKYKAIVEQRGLGSDNMSMLEHITGWKSQESNSPVDNSSGSSPSYEGSS